jgi:predicted membrane channel-forming protein YqfA (hemolysin III family)
MKIDYLALAVLLLGSSPSAFAYLDPGTGSMLLQVILGGIAAVGVALKLFWHKIRIALGMSKKPAAEDEAG